MNTARLAAALILMATVGGCAASPTGYEWGSYDRSLVDYYRNSDRQGLLVDELARLDGRFGSDESAYAVESLERQGYRRPVVREMVGTMRESGERTKRLAPGLQAELGFLHLERGDADKALRAFEREKRSWPESAYFMDVLIGWVKGSGKPARADGRTETTR